MRSINLQMDGNQVCATWDDFIDIHDSPAGFGDTLWSAIGKLIDNTPAKQINGIVSSIENAPRNTKELAATTANSRYVTVLEEDYHILNRMGGALEGCRAELAIVIEHLNATKAPHCT